MREINPDSSSLWKSSGILLVTTLLVWSLVLGFSAYWNLSAIKDHTALVLQQDAESRFLAINTLRKWISSQGGVYVPVSDKTQPHPGLSHIPEQTVSTPSGRELTLMNGFVVAGAIAKQFGVSEGNHFRLTSLYPKNSDNTPDPWETMALGKLDATGEQFSEVSNLSGESNYRLLVPIKITTRCYTCHIYPDSVIGDVAGGIGINLRMDSYLEIERQDMNLALFTHSSIWLLGVIGIGVSGRSWVKQQQAMDCYQKELQSLAIHDPLTGLINRCEMERRFDIELSRAGRYNLIPSIMMLDLDHFKKVNDQHGHQAGDHVLIETSKLIQTKVRNIDIVARYGGEEILIILPETQKRSACALAERIRAVIQQQVIILSSGTNVQVTVSIGVAGYGEDGTDLETLISSADQALYQAKGAGRNRVNCITSQVDELAT